MVNDSVYDRLIQTAKARKTIGYTELAMSGDMMLDTGMDMKNLGLALDGIADQEIAAGRPLLPIVVVSEKTGSPGAGLFRYAKKKGLQKSDDVTFFATELNRVYDYWAKVEPS